MTMTRLGVIAALIACCAIVGAAQAANIVMPQNRHAFYVSEPIEIAVSGLTVGQSAQIVLTPAVKTHAPVSFKVTGDGSSPAVTIAAGTLAPDTYAITLDGVAGQPITVSSGVWDSSLLLSQTVAAGTVRSYGGDFVLGNAGMSSVYDADGQPTAAPRGKYTTSGNAYESDIASNLPTIEYEYWTGFNVHKPWGDMKSWAAGPEMEMMRLMNYHDAQQLRPYRKNLLSIGTMDEPGLSWAKSSGGTYQSGIAAWDEEPYYTARGWDFTTDPGSRPDADWMKYVSIRCGIIKQNQVFANHDWKQVIPETPFATDIYAASAIMDGTDAMNQECNDIPCTHIFDDFSYGKLGVPGGVWLEKSNNPTAKLQHAMNGQLWGGAVSRDGMIADYHLMLNGLLMAGIRSNWWLNNGLSPQDMVLINGPAIRYGGLFSGMQLHANDVAQIWSFTELAMRQKDIMKKLAALPEGGILQTTIAYGGKSAQIPTNPYVIGGNYWTESILANESLLRAGYPALMIEDKALPSGVLKNYKVLVIVHQTYPFPPDIQKAITDFQQGGGKVVVDPGTTITIPGAIRTNATWDDASYWQNLNTQAAGPAQKDKSYVQTNYFMDQLSRDSTPIIKATMQQTKAAPVIVTDSIHLGSMRQAAGEGQLAMVENGFEKLPDLAPTDTYPIFNYAPYQATFHLAGVTKSDAVYAIEGIAWDKVTRLADPTAPINARFDNGEMKLYLIAPRAPSGLSAVAKIVGSDLAVSAQLGGLKMPWPLKVVVTDPTGAAVYSVYRGTNAAGAYTEYFPLGSNAAPGKYIVKITSDVANLSAATSASFKAAIWNPQPIASTVRVFDAEKIKAFLASKQTITIAIGSEAQRPAAEELSTALGKHAVKTQIALESIIMRKRLYPDVWDPYVITYQPGGDQRKPSGTVDVNATLDRGANGQDVFAKSDGTALAAWRKPNTMVTVGPDGWIDLDTGSHDQFYYPGVTFYVNAAGTFERLNTKLVAPGNDAIMLKSTQDFRDKWARPWATSQLTPYIGGCELTPEVPEAWIVDSPLIMLGDSTQSQLVRAVQASNLPLETVDTAYPGAGKALISFIWSPFAVEKNAVLVGATDDAGLHAGIAKLVELGK